MSSKSNCGHPSLILVDLSSQKTKSQDCCEQACTTPVCPNGCNCKAISIVSCPLVKARLSVILLEQWERKGKHTCTSIPACVPLSLAGSLECHELQSLRPLQHILSSFDLRNSFPCALITYHAHDGLNTCGLCYPILESGSE